MSNKPFWSTGIEPLRKFRWRLHFGTGDNQVMMWWAKSVQQPAVVYTTADYQLRNYKLKYIGVVDWEPIEITLVDIEGEGVKYFGDLTTTRDGELTAPRSPKKTNFRIEKIDDMGNPIEEWTFKRPFIISADFGELSYEDDGFVEIKLKIAYDSAKLEKIT